MRRVGPLAGLASLALGALAACAPYPIPSAPAPAARPPPVRAPAAPPAAVQPPPQAAAPQPMPAPPSPPTARDQCGAAALQRLVGRPRSEIPVPLEPSRQRVACTTCPITEDYNPARLNFFFDAQTGLIREIRCG